jgi:hypothetical protein
VYVTSLSLSLSLIIYLNTSFRKAPALPPSCPDYYSCDNPIGVLITLMHSCVYSCTYTPYTPVRLVTVSPLGVRRPGIRACLRPSNWPLLCVGRESSEWWAWVVLGRDREPRRGEEWPAWSIWQWRDICGKRTSKPVNQSAWWLLTAGESSGESSPGTVFNAVSKWPWDYQYVHTHEYTQVLTTWTVTCKPPTCTYQTWTVTRKPPTYTFAIICLCNMCDVASGIPSFINYVHVNVDMSYTKTIILAHSVRDVAPGLLCTYHIHMNMTQTYQ